MFTGSLTGLWILWGAITGVLAILLIYRSVVAMKEDDQLFLGAADVSGSKFKAEQEAIVARIAKLRPFILAFSIASAVVLLSIGGIWVYRGIAGFNNTGLQP